jgi:hypothetical protein
MLQGFSSLSCIDNLYKSMTDWNPNIYLMSQELKDKLNKPTIAAQFELSNQTLLIPKANFPVYYRHTYLDSRFVKYTPTLSTTPIHIVFPSSGEMCVTLNLVDPKYSASKSSCCGEFVKGPLIYMATDDLVVTPMSSFTAISHLNSSNVPMFDMEERVVRIGLNEFTA